MAPTTTRATVLSEISNALNFNYNKLNTNRFNSIDTQIRLDNLNARVNKLLKNIQKAFSMDDETSTSNQIAFY